MDDSRYARFVKRPLDILLAFGLLALLAPLLLAVALAVRTALGPPVLFRQIRAGRYGAPFLLLKFRSMAEGPGDDSARLGTFGRVLRATALDELPQLTNILRGEMSLVGPRPLPLSYLPHYDRRQRSRLAVRPGLAGSAQAAGRNALPWRDRLECDATYAQHVSARGDFRAVLGTIRILLIGQGVSAPGHATMPRFDSAHAQVPEAIEEDSNTPG
ncbi:sugar transferase [Pseudoroseomonas deserti]|uniref:Sugar transferase n=1 Tax=Teichococcus deserti TaxID=1817963 RepID=A0A1V2GUN5_9PROT|nr:sugar transferase [Pseudoroseomonas deserti]ONG44626.1 sugar transferase [Pseudoroseomonas deserti]